MKPQNASSQVAVGAALLPAVLVIGMGQLLRLEEGQQELLYAGGVIMGILTMFATKLMLQGHLDEPISEETLAERQRALQDRLEDLAPPLPVVRRDSVSFQLGLIARHDPGFSEVDVHAWLRELLPRVHEASEAQAVGPLRPYVTRPAWVSVQEALRGALGIEVAWIRLDEVEHGAWDVLRFTVGVLAKRPARGEPVLLRCVLRRSTAARSLSLEEMCRWGCPSCGAPVRLAPPEWACERCGARIADGQLHWQLVQVERRGGDLRATWSPDSGGEHSSLRLPAVIADDLDEALQALELDLPGLDGRIRALMQDGVGLDQTRRFQDLAISWFGGRRLPSPVNVLAVELARVGRDGRRWRMDVRVVLEGVHAILDETGAVLDGNADVPRQWAVYLRLAAPLEEGAPAAPEAWQAWSVLTPQEYLA